MSKFLCLYFSSDGGGVDFTFSLFYDMGELSKRESAEQQLTLFSETLLKIIGIIRNLLWGVETATRSRISDPEPNVGVDQETLIV